MAKDAAPVEEKAQKRERRTRAVRVPAELAANSISPTPAARAPGAQEVPTAVRESRPAVPPVEPQRTDSAASGESPRGAPAGFTGVPDAILTRYYRIGPKYFLDNGELAFTNHGEKLTTPSENSEIARDLVEIARHNGIQDITVSGTERFRHEVWAAATRLGLEVRGYAPTVHDEKQLVRAMAREDGARRGPRDAGRGAEPDGEVSQPLFPEIAPGANAPGPVGSPRARAESPPLGSSRASAQGRAQSEGRAAGEGPAVSGIRSGDNGRAYSGELLDHGSEHYQRNPRENMSYYVELGTTQGSIELWGLDLKRALAEAKSAPHVGDRVVVRQTGQDDVTVRTREFDEAGQFLGERDKDARRNRWRIEKEAFVTERARLAATLRDPNVSAERGGREHPQLLGTYFIVKQAEEFAKERFRTREERQRFVEYTRERLAQAIERGDALPTTRIRERHPERTRSPSREPPAAQGPALA